MRMLRDAIRSSPIWITSLAWGSFVLLVVKLLFLDGIPAPVPAFATLSKLGDDLLTANVAAYLFFLFSVQIPLVHNKVQLGALLDAELATVAHGTTGFLTMLAYSQGQHLEQPITRQTVDDMFAKADPKAPSLMSSGVPDLRTLNWLQAMARHLELTRPAIERTLRQGRYLDADLFRLLNDIEAAPIVESLRDTLSWANAGATLQNESLSAWAANFWDRYQLDQNLDEYRERLARARAIG